MVQAFGITHLRTPVYSPQSSSSERVNHTVLSAIRTYLDQDHRDQGAYLPSEKALLEKFNIISLVDIYKNKYIHTVYIPYFTGRTQLSPSHPDVAHQLFYFDMNARTYSSYGKPLKIFQLVPCHRSRVVFSAVAP